MEDNFTSLEISKRLREVGFRIKGDTITWEPGNNFKDPGERFWRYRADTLEKWLFSKENEMLVIKTIDNGFNVNWGINLFTGKGKSLPDAYADVIIQYFEWQKKSHNNVKL